MFSSLFNRNKISVTLIEALSNEVFADLKLDADQLPESFRNTSTFTHEGEEWQVERVEPLNATEFAETKQLRLWLKKKLKYDPKNPRYSTPTIAHELPAFSKDAFYLEFTHTLHKDAWRQFEFLPAALLPIVEDEMTSVEHILFPENDPDFDSLENGFTAMHVRTKINRQHLGISLEDFSTKVAVQQKGRLKIQGQDGFVMNGFAFKTDHAIYYGTIENGLIKELCLDFFDSMDDEINCILSTYNLLLVAWCRGEIVMG